MPKTPRSYPGRSPLYRDLIEPELNDIHQWLDVPDRSETHGNTHMSLLAVQSELLHLIEVDRRATLLEVQGLSDR
jgi:hypothetical protein